MKKLLLFIVLLSLSTAVGAQTTGDSTDVFFRHLKLNELVVSGLTGVTRLREAPAPISVITGRELRSTAATNIVDAVAHEPGVSQITTGSGISKPVIRGLGYNRMVTVVGGVRQEGQQWGDEHGIEVDAEGVESVEILKGPASLMYGSDAMAGVLILRDAPIVPEGELHGDVSTQYQTNNGLFDYSLRFGGNQKGFVWNARFTDKRAHAYKNKVDGYVPGSQFHERAGQLMLGVNRQWGHSHLSWNVYHQVPSIVEGERDELTGALLPATVGSAGVSPATVGSAGVSPATVGSAGVSPATDNVKTYDETLPFQHVRHYKAVWDQALNLGPGQLKAVVGYQQNQRQEYEESADDYELYFRLHTLTYDLRYLLSELPGWKLNAGAGGMWQRSENLGEEFLIPAYRLLDMGLYVTATRQLEKLTLSGGIRGDRRHLNSFALEDDGDERFAAFSRNFNGLTGSIGAVYSLGETMNVRLNVARGFRAPNMSELGSNGVHEGTLRYEIGNSQLKAEHSLQADLGADWSSPFVSAQVALFVNRISNFIFAHRTNEVMEEGLRTYRYTQGDARLMGFEASVDMHPVHRLHIGSTFSMVDARQLHQPRETRYLPLTPPARWTADVKYELTHSGHTLNNAYVAVGMECCLRQNHYYMADDTETATPSYTLLNMTAGTDVLVGHRKIAELYITVSNLTNRAYQSHLSRLKYCDVNPVTGRQGISNMGRNITLKS